MLGLLADLSVRRILGLNIRLVSQESVEHAESELSADDIILYRDLVHVELDKIAKIEEAQAAKTKEADKGKGWFGGWLGGSKSKEKVRISMLASSKMLAGNR